MKQRDIPARQRVTAPSRFPGFKTGRTPLPARPAASQDYKSLKDTGRGKSLHILACGPSRLETFYPEADGSSDVLAVNKPLMSAKYWLLMDNTQKERNSDIWQKFPGIILTGYAVKPPRRHNQLMIPSTDIEAFDVPVWIGKDSTYVAAQLAYYMNYDFIFIHGLDKCQVNGQTHFYGKNEDAPDEYRIPRFEQELYAWDWAATHLPKEVRQKFHFMSPYCKRDFLRKWNAP